MGISNHSLSPLTGPDVLPYGPITQFSHLSAFSCQKPDLVVPVLAAGEPILGMIFRDLRKFHARTRTSNLHLLTLTSEGVIKIMPACYLICTVVCISFLVIVRSPN